MAAAKEINQWADQCLRWARSARTDEQRQSLQNWEQFLRQVALKAERNFDSTEILDSPTHTKS
jgi:hypothetical protein